MYLRTYSRVKADGTKERWHETVERVVNGTFSMQLAHLKTIQREHEPIQRKSEDMMEDAKEMYTRIFEMKFLPPGRGLWAMGTPITEERKLFAALNNCAFVSTQDIASPGESPAEPFCFLMEASMLGVGVGFDTKGAHQITIQGCDSEASPSEYRIPDSREGWVQATRLLLEAHLQHKPRVSFDYSLIRPAGSPIRGFGGVTSGPASLQKLHASLDQLLGQHIGKPLSARLIVDIMNLMGVCVVSGNVRRTAEIAFGDYKDEEYIALKDYNANPERAAFGWTSNNSVLADIGMDYAPITRRIAHNGEPGLAWLSNMQQFGRMNGVRDDRDAKAAGGNPCLEQTLESYEMCCLVETFPNTHESLEDYKRTLWYAFMYAKTVTLGLTHWPRTNEVMARNRRIGCSMSGIAQFVAHHGLDSLKTWCEDGYDAIQAYDRALSTQFAVPKSIKTTSIKPSGTVSLLAGATPGMHYPESRYYIRRVRLERESELLPALEAAGFPIEPAAEAPDATVVVSIPIDVGDGVRTLDQVSAWEQMALASFLQRYWADNQVSCTVTFDPEWNGPDELEKMLEFFQYQLKGISMLPKIAHGAYKQMPYEQIDAATYRAMTTTLAPLVFGSGIHSGETDVTPVPDQFCDACQIDS